MAETGASYYEAPERFPAAGFTVAILGGALVAFPLGAIYGCVQPLMPLIYIGLLIALLFAGSLGHAVFAALKLGRVRHQGVAVVAAVSSGLVAMAGAWLGDRWVRLQIVLRQQNTPGEVSFFASPHEFLRYVSYFLNEGFWGLRPSLPMFGFPLAVLWLGEAALVVTLCLLVVRRRLRETPYCEPCRRWTVQTKGVRYLIPKTVRGLIDELQRGNAQALLQVAPSSHGAPLALRVDIAQCAGCAASTYLSLLIVSASSRVREFVLPQEKAEIRHLRITPDDAAELRRPPKLAQIAASVPKPRPKK